MKKMVTDCAFCDIKNKNAYVLEAKNNQKTLLDMKSVFKTIHYSIRNNELKPGDKLPSEMELTKFFNVSRGTVREALKSLENFGFLTIKSGSGTYINEVKFDLFLKKVAPFMIMKKNEVIDLMEIREILEVYGAGIAAEHANDEDIAKMQSELLEMEEKISNGESFIEHDLNFHLLVSFGISAF